MRWNRQIASLFHLITGCKDCLTGGIAFGSTSYIDGRLSQNNLCFWHTDAFHCHRSIGGNHNGHWVCIAHIFTGTNHNSSGYKGHTLPCIQHSGQIIHCSIWVWTSHTLDKCWDGIIVIVSALIVSHDSLLDTFLRHFHGNMNLAIFTALCGHHSKFNGI